MGVGDAGKATTFGASTERDVTLKELDPRRIAELVEILMNEEQRGFNIRSGRLK